MPINERKALKAASIPSIALAGIWFSAAAGGGYWIGRAARPDFSTGGGGETVRWLDFEDVADRAGLRFLHSMGGPEKEYLLECMGSGVALLDHDGDGDLDIYLVNGARFGGGEGSLPSRSALFRNDGGLRFTDVTEEAGAGGGGWGFGCAAADYDNDGDADLLVLNWGPDRLYRNQGRGTFREEAEAAGLSDPGWGSSAAFADIDRDGLLDLYVARYIEFDRRAIPTPARDPTCHFKGAPAPCGPTGLPAAPDRLYRNRGDGSFEDLSGRSGILRVAPAYGLGVVAMDFDGDGWVDFFVANDLTPNHLFRNRGDGTFEEVGFERGVALSEEGRAQAGMGIAVGDARGLGHEDLFVTNYEDETNAYYGNLGNGYFGVLTAPLGLAGPSFKALGWSTLFLDADLDGDLDLFVANGHVFPQSDRVSSSPGFRQRSQIFENAGGRFPEATGRSGPGFLLKRSARGAAAGDLDGDGDTDLVVNNLDGPPSLLENRGPPRGHWLAVRARGTRSNRDGIGARVAVRTAARVQMRFIRQGVGYESSSEPVARFGLGEETRIESLEVRWPSGLDERFDPGPADRTLSVVEGEGRQGEGRPPARGGE